MYKKLIYFLIYCPTTWACTVILYLSSNVSAIKDLSTHFAEKKIQKMMKSTFDLKNTYVENNFKSSTKTFNVILVM